MTTKKKHAPDQSHRWYEETSVGLKFLPGRRPTFNQYQAAVKKRVPEFTRLPWVIGDLLRVGEEIFSHEAAQAWDFPAYNSQTLANYASVCRRIPIRNRREDLPFTTHDVVASMKPADQKIWLKRCADMGWTREEFRDAIARANGEETDDDEDHEAADKRPQTFGELIDEAIEILQKARRILTPAGTRWFYFLDMALEALKKGVEEQSKAPVSVTLTGAGQASRKTPAPPASGARPASPSGSGR